MNSARWCTAKDVLKDLADVTGIRDTDEGFIIRGQRPPPRQVTEEDDEIQLRFGRTVDHVAPDASAKPDLAGITKMLRMVDNFHTKENNSCQSSPVKIVISKLNPNVAEFVPKRFANPHCSEQQNVEKKDNENVINNDILEDKVKEKIIETSNSGTISNNPKDILKSISMLKKKIIGTAKGSTMKEKRDRNVALMNLVKLNSTPSPSRAIQNWSSLNSSESNSSKRILLPPQYFYNDLQPSTPVDIDEKYTTSLRPEQESKSSVSDSSGHSSCEPIVDKKVLDPQIIESIEKVNNWLEKPKEKELLAPQLGPIVFRRKESRNKPRETPEIIPKAPVVTPAYVPSTYASDLAKKYEERSKAKEVAATDMWTKLENDLKARDQEIIKRRKEHGEEVAPTSGPSTRCSSRRKNNL